MLRCRSLWKTFSTVRSTCQIKHLTRSLATAAEGVIPTENIRNIAIIAHGEKTFFYEPYFLIDFESG